MEDLTLRYFDAEMRYLRDAAREFAELHPDEARQMGLTMNGAMDESVDRLFQGFAFLMGRIRQKLDDDYPELTEGVISLLGPHYLRPLPSMCVVEIAPEPDALKHSVTIAKHTEVISAPVGDNRVRCRYRTTRSLILQPLSLVQARVYAEPDGVSALRLRFTSGSTAEWQQLTLSMLPLYLNGDMPLASLLHLYLTRRVAQAFIRMPGSMDRAPLALRFRASAYQHLLEYFTFREKFMFVSLEGLEQVTWPETVPWFELELRFTHVWPGEFSVSEENLRLHCVPVVNLFRLDARPLAVNAEQTEYRLQPLREDDIHTEIFAVDSVAASFEEDAPRYTPFLIFQQQGGMLRHERPPRYFHTRVQRGPSGRTETWLILGGEEFERERLLLDEPLALSIIGTNGSLPRMALESTLLEQLAGTPQTPVRVRNLCQPSLPCYPPNENRFHWKLLSQLGSAFLWMMNDAEVLRNTLALCDWTQNDAHRRRLQGIIDVQHHRLEYWKSGLQRGVDIEVTLDTTMFAGEGDVWLFGSLLNRFFAQYADRHLFNRLTLILQPTGHCLRWKENHQSASRR
ncbi:MAG TPA: type VI secretion system baseplate subunit TssF [Escherichia sp.]|uniref:type VI secretion system baseplate subunit TssF n=1 Tax=Pseudescherichia vulneris TaxID=566 RepID=UPI000E9E2381|nr:type VI secretion system baseplate subunit TssF [Pseudescherichia vulneris]HBC81531.1 type VI secretion system baseplate subunit TssF [Escherichia sp.]